LMIFLRCTRRLTAFLSHLFPCIPDTHHIGSNVLLGVMRF
jgi:hypothetical protein